MSQTSVVKGNLIDSSLIYTISFSTDRDRTKGIGTLMKSSHQYRATGKNKFLVTKEVLDCKLFEGKKINYRIISKK